MTQVTYLGAANLPASMAVTAKPDVAFLDIQMPGFTGIELAGRLHVTPVPFIVFVTAHVSHAVQAFEAGAVDPRVFVRIHRSYAVRLDLVRELRTLGPGEYRAVLVNRLELRVSQRYRARLPRP